MSVGLFIFLAILVILAGIAFRMQIGRLGQELFGPDYSIRYQMKRWVIEARVDGQTIKYTTGGLGLFPALTYLYLESDIPAEFSVEAKKEKDRREIPEQIRKEIGLIPSRDGFKRLDAIRSGGSWLSTADRVSFWSHPGKGIMLRRFTKLGGQVDFIKRDIRSLLNISRAFTNTGE